MFKVKGAKGFLTYATQSDENLWTEKNPKTSFLPLNHAAQREAGSEFGFTSDDQWKPEGQAEPLSALTDKYALYFQHLFFMEETF